MKTLKKLINICKFTFVIPIQIIAGLIMLSSILLFALATLIESPKTFAVKFKIATLTIKNIWKDIKIKRIESKLNNKPNDTL